MSVFIARQCAGKTCRHAKAGERKGCVQSRSAGGPFACALRIRHKINQSFACDANIRQIARSMFGDYVVAFELTSVLLIVAVVGTVVLARKRKSDKAAA